MEINISLKPILGSLGAIISLNNLSEYYLSLQLWIPVIHMLGILMVSQSSLRLSFFFTFFFLFFILDNIK